MNTDRESAIAEARRLGLRVTFDADGVIDHLGHLKHTRTDWWWYVAQVTCVIVASVLMCIGAVAVVFFIAGQL